LRIDHLWRLSDMTRVQELAEEIKALSPQELAAFREWFADYDASDWDKQIEADALEGKFDEFAARALSHHQERKTTKI
jgi:hypothetical protein